MATREERIQEWIKNGYSRQLATQIVGDLEKQEGTKTLAPVKTVPVTKKAAAPAGAATHHEDCGEVGETGEHGELGSNAAGAEREEVSAT